MRERGREVYREREEDKVREGKRETGAGRERDKGKEEL